MKTGLLILDVGKPNVREVKCPTQRSHHQLQADLQLEPPVAACPSHVDGNSDRAPLWPWGVQPGNILLRAAVHPDTASASVDTKYEF